MTSEKSANRPLTFRTRVGRRTVVTALIWLTLLIADIVLQRFDLIVLWGAVMLLFCVMDYYGDRLIITDGKLLAYETFRPVTIPIDKIESISPWGRHGLKLHLSDPSVLNSRMPVMILPADKEAFVAAIRSARSSIKILPK